MTCSERLQAELQDDPGQIFSINLKFFLIFLNISGGGPPLIPVDPPDPPSSPREQELTGCISVRALTDCIKPSFVSPALPPAISHLSISTESGVSGLSEAPVPSNVIIAAQIRFHICSHHLQTLRCSVPAILKLHYLQLPDSTPHHTTPHHTTPNQK